MKSIIRIAHIVVNGRKVCQLERVVSRRANRAFALNSKRPALTPECRLRRVFEALRGAA